MRKDGRLTKREERTVVKAVEIISEWVSAHMYDERPPYGWDSIAANVHQLEGDMWTMFGEAYG